MCCTYGAIFGNAKTCLPKQPCMVSELYAIIHNLYFENSAFQIKKKKHLVNIKHAKAKRLFLHFMT